LDSRGETNLKVRAHHCDITLLLYDGYDWAKTRKTIEDEVKQMRRRLAKIRQLLASGHTQDPIADETGTLLFNSVYIGLEQDVDGLEPGALIAVIDEELNDDIDTVTQTSWQSVTPEKAKQTSTRMRAKRLTRFKGPSIEFKLTGVVAEFDQFRPDEVLASRTFATIKDLEILDHIKTSTWKKFLTELRTDTRGNVRETESNMVQIELSNVHPVGHPSEESRLRVSHATFPTYSLTFCGVRQRFYPSGFMLIKMPWTSSRSSSVLRILMQ
jgi:autophagy-related protein 2